MQGPTDIFLTAELDTTEATKYPYARVKDESFDGAGDGSPNKSATDNNAIYAILSVMAKAGATPNAVPENVTDNTQFFDALSTLCDTEYAPISSTTDESGELSKDATGTYTYTIANFAGTGLKTDQIRGLYIRCFSETKTAFTYINATFPDGTTKVIARSKAASSGDEVSEESVEFVPINKGTTSIDISVHIENANDLCEFTIEGAQQRTFPTTIAP
jgi:hypothetical protein